MCCFEILWVIWHRVISRGVTTLFWKKYILILTLQYHYLVYYIYESHFKFFLPHRRPIFDLLKFLGEIGNCFFSIYYKLQSPIISLSFCTKKFIFRNSCFSWIVEKKREKNLRKKTANYKFYNPPKIPYHRFFWICFRSLLNA